MHHNACSDRYAAATGATAFPRGAVPRDCPALEFWLVGLRTLDLRAAVTQLLLVLEPLSQKALETETRYLMVRALKGAVLRIGAALRKVSPAAQPRVVPPLTLPSSQPHADEGHASATSRTLEQRLYAAMAGNCVQLLHELDRGQVGYSEDLAERRRWAVRNAFRFVGRQLLCAIDSRQGWPPGAWQSLHDLFVNLVMRGSVRLHHELLILTDEAFDPEHAYKRLLLIGLLAELVEPGRIDPAAIARLRELAGETRLVESDGLVGEYGLTLVEVGRDQPPRRRAGSLNDPFRGWVLRVPPDFESLIQSLDPFHRYRSVAAA
jgi:hypothetical protein